MASSLTARRLRELLLYNPRTGEFTWLVNLRGRYARIGARAGVTHRSGRRMIRVDRKLYLAARLAFFWMNGRWPKQLIDHKNCDPGDDRWSNLREATHSQNHANGPDRKSAAPLKGVQRSDKKYMAQIRVKNRNIYLGRFDTPELAHAAYATAARKYFGAYARLK